MTFNMKHCFSINVESHDLLTSQLAHDFERLLSSVSSSSDKSSRESSVLKNIVQRAPAQIPSYDLIKWMELSAAYAAKDYHAENAISRGHLVNFEPKSEAHLGDTVDFVVEVEKANRKLIYFNVEARVGGRLIAKMSHKRFIFSLE